MEDMRQAKSRVAASFASEGMEPFKEFKVCPSFPQFIDHKLKITLALRADYISSNSKGYVEIMMHQ
ncbi:hypothetical protein HN51_071760, partial [Arachis hypogaea]